jgi:hypothetical protein
VEFVVVGGYAVAFHGHPRATKDLDLLVRATPSNAHRVYRALGEFGAPLHAGVTSTPRLPVLLAAAEADAPPAPALCSRPSGTASQTTRRG